MLRITPIRTPERASDHLARVHRYGGDASPPGKQQRRHDGTLAQQAGFDLEAFVARTRQAGQRTLTHSPSIDGSTVNDPSAPLSSTRVEGL